MKCSAVNLSNVIWADGVEPAYQQCSIFLLQFFPDPDNVNVEDLRYFQIRYGDELLEDGKTLPLYLAVIRKDGRYSLERAEKYLNERDDLWQPNVKILRLDAMDLPEEMNRLHFQKAENFQNSPMERSFNRWRADLTFCQESRDPSIWLIEKHIETDRLILLPGKNARDNDAFLTMLKNDGDFQMFCGLPYNEQNLLDFDNYLEQNFLFSVFSKDNPGELLGYVGIAPQHGRYEIEFYIKRTERNRGYCEEAVNAICKAAFAGDFAQVRKPLVLHEIYTTTQKENLPTRRVLEKCGFAPVEGPVFVFQLLVHPVTDEVYQDVIVEYVRKEP